MEKRQDADAGEFGPPDDLINRDDVIRYLLGRLGEHSTSYMGSIDAGRIEELTHNISTLIRGVYISPGDV